MNSWIENVSPDSHNCVRCGLGQVKKKDDCCLICSVIRGDEHVPFASLMGSERNAEQIICVRPGLRVIADVAPIVPGHILIVTESHITSMAKCSQDLLDRVASLKRELEGMFESKFGMSPVWFEHGECKDSSKDRCGIYHAHLHGLPAPASVFADLKRRIDFQSVKGMRDFVQTCCSESYIYIETVEHGAHVALMNPPSQMLRKAICQALNHEERWNWHKQITLFKNHTRSRIEEGLGKMADLENLIQYV